MAQLELSIENNYEQALYLYIVPQCKVNLFVFVLWAIVYYLTFMVIKIEIYCSTIQTHYRGPTIRENITFLHCYKALSHQYYSSSWINKNGSSTSTMGHCSGSNSGQHKYSATKKKKNTKRLKNVESLLSKLEAYLILSYHISSYLILYWCICSHLLVFVI